MQNSVLEVESVCPESKCQPTPPPGHQKSAESARMFVFIGESSYFTFHTRVFYVKTLNVFAQHAVYLRSWVLSHHRGKWRS